MQRGWAFFSFTKVMIIYGIFKQRCFKYLF